MSPSKRPEIERILVRLRRGIRRYVFLEGIAAFVALGCFLFWLTFVADVAYFEFSQLELPKWLRVFVLILGAGLLAGVLIVRVIGRLTKPIRPADLALALERRFPDLNDRLITAVELEHRGGSPEHTSMLDRTMDEAAQRLTSLRIQETINPRPLRRMLTVAGVLLATVLVFGLTNAHAMERWYHAYILGRNDYWEPFRKNQLDVRVIAQPGERVREFNQQGVYKHPRGEDLQLQALVPDETLPPEQVTLQFVSFGSSGQQRGRVTMSRLGDSEFRHTFSRVVDDHQLWFRGGDYVNRQPFRIQIVEPPHVDALQLHCDYPSYTGMDDREDRPLLVVGTQVDLPMETAFTLEAVSNKPLMKVHLHGRYFQLSFGHQAPDGKGVIPTTFTIRDPETGAGHTLPMAVSPEEFFTSDRRGFRVPFRITAKAEEQLAQLKSVELPLPLVPDETLQIALEDDDQIYSPEPAVVTINGIVDESPVVDTRRTGVGPLVTRMANIPIEGRLVDDYGIADAWFGYRVDEETETSRQNLANAPRGQSEFRLGQSPERPVELFNLIPLELEEGQTLTLAVHAQDGDTLNGPHMAHGEPLAFKIVSGEELLAKLYDREVNLRLRFEQIRSEVSDLRNSVEQTRNQVRDELAEPRPDQQADGAASARVVQGHIDRALHQIRKNHTESRSIEVSFRDLRDEMVNNRIDTEELLERIEQGVIEPLSLLNSNEFLEVDRRLGVFRLAVESGSNALPSAEAVLPAVDQLLAVMDAILAEMRDRGTFNELIQNLQDIIDRQKQLLEETEEKRIEDNFFTPLN